MLDILYFQRLILSTHTDKNAPQFEKQTTKNNWCLSGCIPESNLLSEALHLMC